MVGTGSAQPASSGKTAAATASTKGRPMDSPPRTQCLATRAPSRSKNCRRLPDSIAQERGCEARAIQRRRAVEDRKSTRELQSLMRISYAVFFLKKKKSKHL